MSTPPTHLADVVEQRTRQGTQEPTATSVPAIEYMVALGPDRSDRTRKIAVIEGRDGYDLPPFGVTLDRPIRRVGLMRQNGPDQLVHVRMGRPVKHPRPGALTIRLKSVAELEAARRLGNIRPEAFDRIIRAHKIATARGVANGFVPSVKLPQRNRVPRPELGS